MTLARTLLENTTHPSQSDPSEAGLFLCGEVLLPTPWAGASISLAICPAHRCLFHHRSISCTGQIHPPRIPRALGYSCSASSRASACPRGKPKLFLQFQMTLTQPGTHSPAPAPSSHSPTPSWG